VAEAQWVPEALSLGEKQPEHEADPSSVHRAVVFKIQGQLYALSWETRSTIKE